MSRNYRDEAVSLARDLLASLWRALPFRLRERVLLITQSTFTVGVSAVLCNPRAEVLLTRHRFRYSSSWQLPGGFMSRGESLEEAILRELREELGVAAHVRRQLRAHVARAQHLDVCFLCQMDGETHLNETELLEARFFPREALPVPLGDGVRTAVEEAFEQSVTRAS